MEDWCQHAATLNASTWALMMWASRLISSHLISSHLISSHLISSHLISCHLISSHLISSHLISSRLVSSRLISSLACSGSPLERGIGGCGPTMMLLLRMTWLAGNFPLTSSSAATLVCPYVFTGAVGSDSDHMALEPSYTALP